MQLKVYLGVALVVPLLSGLTTRAGLARVHYPLPLELAVSLVLLVWGREGWSIRFASFGMKLFNNKNGLFSSLQFFSIANQNAKSTFNSFNTITIRRDKSQQDTGAAPAAMRFLLSMPCALCMC